MLNVPSLFVEKIENLLSEILGKGLLHINCRIVLHGEEVSCGAFIAVHGNLKDTVLEETSPQHTSPGSRGVLGSDSLHFSCAVTQTVKDEELFTLRLAQSWMKGPFQAFIPRRWVFTRFIFFKKNIYFFFLLLSYSNTFF